VWFDLEDIEDLAAIAERRDEPSIPHEEAEAKALSAPDMRESIREGLKTPLTDCDKEPGW
jgi:hypothetical protein